MEVSPLTHGTIVHFGLNGALEVSARLVQLAASQPHCITYTRIGTITAQLSGLLLLCKRLPLKERSSERTQQKSHGICFSTYSSRRLEHQWPCDLDFLRYGRLLSLDLPCLEGNRHVNAARSAGCYLLSQSSNLIIPNGHGVVVVAGDFLYCYPYRYAMWGIDQTSSSAG